MDSFTKDLWEKRYATTLQRMRPISMGRSILFLGMLFVPLSIYSSNGVSEMAIIFGVLFTLVITVTLISWIGAIKYPNTIWVPAGVVAILTWEAFNLLSLSFSFFLFVLVVLFRWSPILADGYLPYLLIFIYTGQFFFFILRAPLTLKKLNGKSNPLSNRTRMFAITIQFGGAALGVVIGTAIARYPNGIALMAVSLFIFLISIMCARYASIGFYQVWTLLRGGLKNSPLKTN